jgi:hypothetical protein
MISNHSAEKLFCRELSEFHSVFDSVNRLPTWTYRRIERKHQNENKNNPINASIEHKYVL